MNWKEIEEHKGYYINEEGEIFSKISNRKLIPQKYHNKYQTKKEEKICYWWGIKLGGRNGKNCKIHLLLGKAFIPNPNNYKEIDHINRNPLDNRLVNLRWISRSGNCMNRGVQNNNKLEEKNICVDITTTKVKGKEYTYTYYYVYGRDIKRSRFKTLEEAKKFRKKVLGF